MRPACGRFGRKPLMSHLYDDVGPWLNVASLWTTGMLYIPFRGSDVFLPQLLLINDGIIVGLAGLYNTA